jgi:uncharacterized protein DUF732
MKITKMGVALAAVSIALGGAVSGLGYALTHDTPVAPSLSVQHRAEYASYVRAHTVSFSTYSDDRLVALGLYVCSSYQQNMDTFAIGSEIYPGHGANDTGILIGAATGYICPQFRP